MVCLSGDLTRQCEVDLFQAEFPDRFIQAGMAEANMMGVAGALARCGHLPFVHTFGVFATRRPLDQIINAIAYPRLPVRIIGFMPGISSPGGPSHQAIDDVALMRAVPGMTVLDVADAVEVRQVCALIADLPGPVYVRLKRGEMPLIFDDDHPLVAGPGRGAHAGRRRGPVRQRDDAGPRAGRGPAARRARGGACRVVNVPVIKPLDAGTVLDAAAACRVVLSAENHSVIGGLGSAVAEALAEAGRASGCAGSGWPTPSPRGRAAPATCSASTACPPRPSWTRPGRRWRRPGPAPEGPRSPDRRARRVRTPV